MNIDETKALLSMIWSLYPNAPKLSPEDKAITAVSWFNLLYIFTLNDAWEGAKRCFKENPRFVPTAPEILKNTRKTLCVEKFIDDHYVDMMRSVDEEEEFVHQVIASYYKRKTSLNEEERMALLIAQNNMNRLEAARLLFNEAYEKAEQEYDRVVRENAFINAPQDMIIPALEADDD